MGQPYVGEIRMFGGNFAPLGWMFCGGQLLAISEYETLFNLIGTTYGGDGQSTFALPNLQSRTLIHQGTGGGGTYVLAQTGGVENVTLTVNQIPQHNHLARSQGSGGNSNLPNNNYLSDEGPQGISNVFTYAPFDQANSVTLNSATLMATGGSQSHTNLQPFLCVSFIISMFGIYPSPG